MTVSSAGAVAGAAITTKRYYTMGGATVGVRDSAGSGSLSYLLGDQLGSTTVSVNASGGTPVVQRYLPYGAPRSTTGGSAVTDRGWIGQTKDASTGLQYLNARYYDPTIGRFTATDPLADLSSSSSLDAYGYAGGSPATLSDRTGLALCLDAHSCSSKRIVQAPWGNGPTPTERRQQCILTCTGKTLVDAIAADRSLGVAVFRAIDVAKEGSLDDLDGNWSTHDIDAAARGTHLGGIARAMGLQGDQAEGFVALVRDVAGRLRAHEELWESIDHEANFLERNGGTISTVLSVVGTAADAVAFAGYMSCFTGIGCGVAGVASGVSLSTDVLGGLLTCAVGDSHSCNHAIAGAGLSAITKFAVPSVRASNALGGSADFAANSLNLASSYSSLAIDASCWGFG